MQERYEQFSFVVSAINRHIQKLERDEMIKFGYKGAFAQYLMAMRHYPQGVTSAQLSEMCDKDKAAVSRNVGEMIEKGLVVRKSATDSLYRAKLILSQEGEKIADFVANRASAAIEAMGEHMGEEQRKSLYFTLDAIEKRLDFLSQKGIPQE